MTITQRYLGPGGLEEDRYWMGRALAQAKRCVGATSPNPPVGAVIVKGHRLLGGGHTAPAGGAHAEVNALQALADRGEAAGSTLYVTLEPCSTQGRTPPCTTAILDHGIGRVVFGSVDPNPSHVGSAVALLEAAGVEVTVGVLREDTDRLIRVFRHWILHGRPYIIVKAGVSLDGCLTRPDGESTWLTSPDARQDAQNLRILVDAMLVGAETIRQDDPKLTVRHPWVPDGKRPLKRYVLTRTGNLPEDAKVFTDSLASETRVIREARWPDWLERLSDEDVTSILLEGGGRTVTEALQGRAVHELHLYLAPRLAGMPARWLTEALGMNVTLDDVAYAMIGDNVKVSGTLHYHD